MTSAPAPLNDAMTVRAIAQKAVDLLLSLGCYGLDRSKQLELWQEALDLDRLLHPEKPAVTVWAPGGERFARGGIVPPEHAGSGGAVPGFLRDRVCSWFPAGAADREGLTP